jgi:hypothetical protein
VIQPIIAFWVVLAIWMVGTGRGRRALAQTFRDMGHVLGFRPTPADLDAELVQLDPLEGEARVWEQRYMDGRIATPEELGIRFGAAIGIEADREAAYELDLAKPLHVTPDEANQRLKSLAEYHRLQREADAMKDAMAAPLARGGASVVVPIIAPPKPADSLRAVTHSQPATATGSWTATANGRNATDEEVTYYDANGGKRTILREPLPTEPDPRLVGEHLGYSPPSPKNPLKPTRREERPATRQSHG